MTPEEFRAAGYQLVDWIAEYVEGVPERPVGSDVEPGAVRARLPEHPPSTREPWTAVLSDLEDVVVPGLVHWQHPSFFAYFPANSSYASILG